MAMCATCGGLVMEPGKLYGWAGPVCHCAVVQQVQKIIDKAYPASDAEIRAAAEKHFKSDHCRAAYLKGAKHMRDGKI